MAARVEVFSQWVSLVAAVVCVALSAPLAVLRSIESVSEPSRSLLVVWDLVLIAVNGYLARRAVSKLHALRTESRNSAWLSTPEMKGM